MDDRKNAVVDVEGLNLVAGAESGVRFRSAPPACAPAPCGFHGREVPACCLPTPNRELYLELGGHLLSGVLVPCFPLHRSKTRASRST